MNNNYDLYRILGVNPNAKPEEIKKSYRNLAKKYHPDLNPGKNYEERLKLINAAYDIISDPEKRRKYESLAPDASDILSARYLEDLAGGHCVTSLRGS